MLIDPPEGLTGYRRIVVQGVTGSGKSALAVRLAAVGGMPHVSVDDLMWRPGWVQLEKDAQVEAIRPRAAEPEWVMDSLWTSIRPVVLPRTDLLVALDYPRWVSLTRLVNRTLRRLVDHQEVCGGNTEAWRQTLSRDSIIAWHFRSFARKHCEIEAWSTSVDGPPVLRFTDPRATEAWVRRLEAGPVAG